MAIRIPVGKENFDEIRKSGLYYRILPKISDDQETVMKSIDESLDTVVLLLENGNDRKGRMTQ